MILTQQLADRRIFIVYGLSPGTEGKFDKIPANPITQHAINSQDPAQHMLGADAATYAAALNLLHPVPPIVTEAGLRQVVAYGVGIVIAEGSGLAFIDLDHAAAPNGGWKPHVSAFEALFPGAYKETSVSRAGRHIVCSYTGALDPHGTRNRTYQMEAYTRGRFMAVGDIDASGSPLTDCTAALTAFLQAHFQRDAVEPGEWRTEPVPGWNGPTDDAELIARAMRSMSIAGAFRKKAMFRDLWTNNTDVLLRTFPQGDGYDHSAADQALANHLCFWTGADCPRIQRLMLQSGLVRDKWHREDYLPRTILKALSDAKEFYKGKQSDDDDVPSPPAAYSHAASDPVATPEHADVPLPPGVPTPPAHMAEAKVFQRGERPAPGTLVTISQMQQIFDGYVYVMDIDKMQFPNGNTASKARFDSMMGGAQYATTAIGDKPSKSAWDAYTMNEVHDFPRAETQHFRPDLPTGTITRRGRFRLVNSYFPAEIRREEGDAAPFLDFVHKLLPHGRDAELLVAYMAACSRYLGRKFSWCVFLQGTKGNGKTTIAKVMQYCCGIDYSHWAKAKELGEKFNAHLTDKILVVIDEMYSDDKFELQELLKELVTSDRIETRPMYAEKVMKEICFNMVLISNHQNAVRIDVNERRYAPLFCAQQEKSDLARDGLTKAYFRELYAWLEHDNKRGFAIVHDYLMRLDIPEEFDPTKLALHAPETTSTDKAAVASLGGIEQEIANAIEQKQDGFRNGWISEHSLDLLLARLGKDKFIQRSQRRSMVKALGYDAHPSLPEGACDVPLPEGICTRLYIKRGHPWAVPHLSAQQVLDGYVEHQRVR
jgi:hypothetical protein